MSPTATPSEWLRHARSDLALARAKPPPGVLLESLCFHAQQAAEKALKAVLVARDIPPPGTHNIRTLLEMIPEDYPADVEDAAVLTAHAIRSIYPGDLEPVDETGYRRALELAQAVLDWASEEIGKSGDCR